MTPSADPLVSVIIPVYITSAHQARLLDETLRTVWSQTYQRYEVIVVDDGSAVDLSALATARVGTRRIRQTNAGCAAARNTGIAASAGEFLIFLDGDDHLLPAALETGVEQLRSRPECG